jgi:hypothetical protein
MTHVIDGSNWETQVDMLAGCQDILEIGAVPATHVRCAFEKMTDDQGTGKLVELVCGPLMPPTARS